MNGRFLTDNAWPRSTRAYLGMAAMLMAKMVLTKLGPSTVERAIANKMFGTASQISTKRINTLSSQRPCFQPTSYRTPTRRNPQRSCSEIDAIFALSPITAITWRRSRASHSRSNACNRLRPMPQPALSARR